MTRSLEGLAGGFSLVLCWAESTFHERVRKLREEVASPAQLTEGGDKLQVRPGDGEKGADPDRFGETAPQSLAEA